MKTMHTSPIERLARPLAVGLLGALFVLTGPSCAVGGDKVAAQTQTVLTVLKTLEAQPKIDEASLGASLDTALTRDEAQSDASFAILTGKPRPGGRAPAEISTVELRVPGAGSTAKGPFVYLTLDAARSPTMTQVVEAFGRATKVDVPRPNPEKAMVLVYQTPRGQLRFGIGVGPEQKVVSATIDRTE